MSTFERKDNLTQKKDQEGSKSKEGHYAGGGHDQQKAKDQGMKKPGTTGKC